MIAQSNPTALVGILVPGQNSVNNGRNYGPGLESKTRPTTL